MWRVRYFDDQTERWFTGMTACERNKADELCGWLQQIGWEAKVEPDLAGDVHGEPQVARAGDAAVAPVTTRIHARGAYSGV